MIIIKGIFFKFLASKFKDLELNLKKARIYQTKKEFVRKIFVTSFGFSLVSMFLVFVFFDKFKIGWVSIPIFPILFFLWFLFFMNYPIMRAIKIAKNIDGEIVAAIRFILLDLKAGRSLYNILIDISKNFRYIGEITNEIVREVEIGSTFEEALSNKANEIESEYFRVLLWQMLNHLKTGADIAETLRTISYEIEEKQRIDYKKFGKKLNSLSVLYMVIAIIIPTIGFMMFSAYMVFVGYDITVGMIIGTWLGLTTIQLFFLVSSTSDKPPIDID